MKSYQKVSVFIVSFLLTFPIAATTLALEPNSNESSGLRISPTTLPSVTRGLSSYSITITASGGVAPYDWSSEGAFVPGMEELVSGQGNSQYILRGDSCQLALNGSYRIVLRVTDSSSTPQQVVLDDFLRARPTNGSDPCADGGVTNGNSNTVPVPPGGSALNNQNSNVTNSVRNGNNNSGTRNSGGPGPGGPVGDSFYNPLALGSIQDIPSFIVRIIQIILTLTGMLAVLFIIIGGLRYITSAGQPEQAKAAKNTVTYAIIGLVISVLSFAIVNVITNLIINK